MNQITGRRSFEADDLRAEHTSASLTRFFSPASRALRLVLAFTLLLVFASLFSAALAVPASASAGNGPAAPAARPDAPGNGKSLGADDNIRALEHWTPERMKNAKPAEPKVRAGAPGPVGEVERGKPEEVPPALPEPGAATPEAARSSLATSTSTATSATEGYWQASNTANPNSQIGRLFFQAWDPTTRTWKDYTCSGTVVNSENKSVVWTAGHCVFSTFANTWNRAYQFCPGYRNGSCPYGVWTAATQYTTTQWQNAVCSADVRCMPNEFLYDLGALKMNTYNGVRIAAHVGSHGIQFNGATYQYRYSFGYPLNKSNGQYMYYCSGNNTYVNGSLHLGNCTATGGASGGPWLSQVNSSWLGVVHSVNSSGGVNYMTGPYQGSVAQNLFALARY